MGSITNCISWPIVFGSVIGYYVLLAFYRLFLHPLARIPGPKLAAISRWYEAYYDVIQGGKYTLKISELHSKYGPIVRISPYELHINDPAFFNTLYPTDGRGRWDKYSWTYDAFGAKGSAFTSRGHDAHKAYRRPIAPFFSKPNVTAREHLLVKNTKKLCARIAEYVGKDVDVGAALSAVSRDNANNFILEKEYNDLDLDDFGVETSFINQGVGFLWRTTKHLPWFGPAMRALPVEWVLKIADKSTRNFLHLFQKSERDTQAILEDAKSLSPDTKELNTEGPDTKEQPTIVHAIIQSNLPPADKSFERIFGEVTMVSGAAFETAANSLRLIIFHVYANSDILHRLRREISTALLESSEPLTWKKLEQLPYLTAVLTEGMRLSPGVSTRMARITDKDMFYENWRIPAGTPVGMTSLMLHTDEKQYPDPMRFDPDRWLGENAKASANSVYAPFGKGTRNCLGMHLAWAEMYYTVAGLVQGFDFKIKDAVASDFEMTQDNFGIGTKAGCNLVVHVSLCDAKSFP